MASKIPPDAYAIIIGSMKCGTSSLFSYLARHPAICPAIDKEPEFFSESQGHGTTVDRYEDLWPFDADVHEYALEASTGYTKYPSELGVPKRIRDYGLTPRFIYIVRNPFDRIASHINYLPGDRSRPLEPTDDQVIATSNYFIQLEQYREYFPQESILVLDFDELKGNATTVLGKTYEFLGLEPHYPQAGYDVVNPTQVESALVRSMRASNLSGIIGLVPGPLRRAAKRLLRRASPPAKRTLTPSEEDVIRTELAADMARLHRTYGVDVARWGFET